MIENNAVGLIDTDILIDVLRKFKNAVAWLKKINEEEIIIPGFVLMELIQGCRNTAEKNKIEKAFNKFDVIWPTVETCKNAYSIFSKYYFSHGVGIIDSIIGQIAIDLNLPIQAVQ